MEKTNSLRNFILIILVFTIHSFTSGQVQMSTELDYKEKGRTISTASIYFSDDNGAENVSPEDFLLYQEVYFTILSADNDGNGYFREKDIAEDLSLIYLYQEGERISPAGQLKPLTNQDGKIDRVLMQFSKRDIKLYKPFEFISPIDTASPIKLADKYFMHFFSYEPIYIDGLNYSDDKDYLAAYNTFMEIVEDAQTKSEIKYYSFWESASQTYIQTAIEQYTDSLSNSMERANAVFKRSLSKVDLEKQDSLRNLILDAQETFMPYMQMDFPNSALYREKFIQLIAEADSFIDESNLLFNQNRMRFLETETYANSYEFQLYIDIIARMLCDLDTLKTISGLQPIDIALLEKMPEKNNMLIEADWIEKFNIILEVINVNIATKGIVFNDSVMNNLQRQTAEQRQPYHEIFRAFNYKSKKPSLFKDFLSNAISKCTDDNLLENLEMWVLSYNLTHNNVDTKIVSRINEGIRLIDAMQWSEAQSLFGILTRQASNIAPPWYYEGVIKFEEGGQFSAESKFDRALEINAEYIAPRVFSFDILYEQNNLEGLMDEIEDAIEHYDIWLFHFWKSKALVAQAKYQEAIAEIENECIATNPWDVDTYFLLGDAYRELNKLEKAREAYRQTQVVDPYMDSEVYDTKMTQLLELENN